MKFLFITISILLLTFSSSAQKINPNYDSTLAKKLGADQYGMKPYVLVILKTGSNKTAGKSFIDSCFAGHMQNIQKMEKDGKLFVAGPIAKNDRSYRGIFILNVANFEEAIKLMESDPAIREKILEIELFKWYGSAALGEYLDDADKIWKVNP